MIFKLTTKGFKVSKSTYEYISQHFDKIIQSLPNIEEDLIVFRLVLKKDTDRYHPSRTHTHPHKDYSHIKPALAHYDGSITFRLDKKQLYVHFKGQGVDECIDSGFRLIFRELEKFKDLHFSSESEYPNHSSIRRRSL